jgi:lipopolysaccharide export system ATP-binding protein
MKPEPELPGFIATENLVRLYGRRRVVDQVNLHIAAGEIVGLLGPNGAGKTTSFYMIVGLIRATSGEVFMGDRQVTKMPMHRRARLGIGYLPQEPSVFRSLTVAENLLAVAETLRKPRRERKALVTRFLEELDLTRVAGQKAYTLSGGERRRLEISRALVTGPRFFFFG